MKKTLLILLFSILALAGCSSQTGKQAGGGFMNLQEMGVQFSNISELNAILSPESVASSTMVGGSQTPWTSNIAGAGYNLTGVGVASSSTFIANKTSSPTYTFYDSTTAGMGFNAGILTVTNGSKEMYINSSYVQIPGLYNTAAYKDRTFSNGEFGSLLTSTGTKTDWSTSTINIAANGYTGIGTTTPLVPLQATTQTVNATTTIEFGKAGQNKGTCLKLYNNSGTVTYCSITGTTLSCSATSCQ